MNQLNKQISQNYKIMFIVVVWALIYYFMTSTDPLSILSNPSKITDIELPSVPRLNFPSLPYLTENFDNNNSQLQDKVSNEVLDEVSDERWTQPDIDDPDFLNKMKKFRDNYPKSKTECGILCLKERKFRDIHGGEADDCIDFCHTKSKLLHSYQ